MTTLDTMLGSIFNGDRAKIKREEQRRTARDRYHAKKIASRLGIDLTIERAGDGTWACWIEYHVSQVGPKGWTDQLYCHSWGEVREKLEEIEAGVKC